MFQKGCFLIQKQNISQQTTNSQSALVELKIKEMQEGAWEGTVAIIWFQMEYCRDLISKLGKVQRLYLGDEGAVKHSYKPLRLTSQQCEGCRVLLPPGLDASQTQARIIQGSMLLVPMLNLWPRERKRLGNS